MLIKINHLPSTASTRQDGQVVTESDKEDKKNKLNIEDREVILIKNKYYPSVYIYFKLYQTIYQASYQIKVLSQIQ